MKTQSRQYSTPVLQLDIRLLQRRGVLIAGSTAALRWDATTTANITAMGNVVRVCLKLEHADLTDEFSVVHTPAGFGLRGWWRCPRCRRRCAVLFLQERFACRECSGLHYATQSATARRRALLKANKLRALYGADPDFPQRPRYMRQEKFDSKMAKAEAALSIALPGSI